MCNKFTDDFYFGNSLEKRECKANESGFISTRFNQIKLPTQNCHPRRFTTKKVRLERESEEVKRLGGVMSKSGINKQVLSLLHGRWTSQVMPGFEKLMNQTRMTTIDWTPAIRDVGNLG